MRKRRSQAERRQIPAPRAPSADCQSSSHSGWADTGALYAALKCSSTGSLVMGNEKKIYREN